MMLKLKHKENTECFMIDETEEWNDIQHMIKTFCDKYETTTCKFELFGEADLKIQVRSELKCLFG